MFRLWIWLTAFAGLALAHTDPKHCEVCLKVMSDIHTTVRALEDPKDKRAIEAAIDTYCGGKRNARERKLCYYILPIKRTVSTPFSFGVDAAGVCKKLDRSSAEICAVKYPIVTQPGGKTDYKRMRVRELRQILRERGVSCRGCVEKAEFVKKCENTEHLVEL